MRSAARARRVLRAMASSSSWVGRLLSRVSVVIEPAWKKSLISREHIAGRGPWLGSIWPAFARLVKLDGAFRPRGRAGSTRGLILEPAFQAGRGGAEVVDAVQQ